MVCSETQRVRSSRHETRERSRGRSWGVTDEMRRGRRRARRREEAEEAGGSHFRYDGRPADLVGLGQSGKGGGGRPVGEVHERATSLPPRPVGCEPVRERASLFASLLAVVAAGWWLRSLRSACSRLNSERSERRLRGEEVTRGPHSHPHLMVWLR
eukprot:689740-Hanusia_phi.AAC.1